MDRQPIPILKRSTINFIETKDYITLSIAVLGAGLGITNLIRSIAKDRINLKLRLSLEFILKNPEADSYFGLKLEVVNLGFVPLTISEGYLETSDGSIYSELQVRSSMNEQHLPVRLGIREAVTLVCETRKVFNGTLEPPVGVAVKTSCGLYKKAAGKLFKRWVRSRTRGSE